MGAFQNAFGSGGSPDPSSATTNIVNRTVDDTTPITFSWPVTGAAITAQASKNNGAYIACEGTVSFVRTESGKHYYALAFDASDRLTEEGTVRYAFTDGTYTRYVPVYLSAGGTGSGLTGDFVLTPIITDVSSGDPIEGAKVRLYRTGETGTEYTDVNGEIDFNVGAFTWNYVVTARGYVGTSGAVTVSADATLPITLNESPLSVPSDPDICRLTVGFSTVHGVPIVGAVVTPVLIASPELVIGGYALNEATPETTDVNGFVVIDFIQGITVRLDVEFNTKCYQIRVTVPALATDTLELVI